MAISNIGTVGLGTAAVQIVDANDWREIISIFNAGAGTVMVGPTSSVGSASGYPIPAGETFHSLSNSAIYGISSGTATYLVHYHEVVS